MRECVVNASPLIALGRLNRIAFLPSLFEPVRVPLGVADEILAGPADDPARLWLESQGSAYVDSTTGVVTAIAGWDLGKGESEVLSLAHGRQDCLAVLDDAAARRCANVLGIRCLGTLGVIMLAKRKGLIPSAVPLVETLITSGFRVKPSLLDEFRRLVDEQ